MRYFFLTLLCVGPLLAAERFTVATYNIENYRSEAAGDREPKSAESKTRVHDYLLSFKPDVLALQEIGSVRDLEELQSTLKGKGLDYPHSDFVDGPDPSIDLAILSRFPIEARRPHADESFLLHGKRFRVARGFLEADIKVNDKYHFTLITAHLKSRRVSAQADEAELREQEAILLRAKVDAALQRKRDVNLIVLGDFNDVRSSRSVRAVMGRGRTGLFDLRPAEKNGDTRTTGREALDDRAVTWTHFFARDDSYSRVDYIFVSQAMAKEWLPQETYIPRIPNWGSASDHRPIVATFDAVDGK